MKTINVAEFKTNLSRYLRRVRRGESFVVMSRREPVAEVSPASKDGGTVVDRRGREGGGLAPTRRIEDLRFTAVGRGVEIQRLLREVREEGA